MDAYRALIRENISYGDLIREHPYTTDLIDGYVELMAEVCCTQRETVWVNQEELPAAVVLSRFLELNREHILYVMGPCGEIPSRWRISGAISSRHSTTRR